MNDLKRTLCFVVVAVLGILAAFLMTPGPIELEQFAEEGQLFFPEFKDLDQVAELEVTGFDASTTSRSAFVVKKNAAGRFVIPSHYDYPADATQRMAATSAFALGLRKESVRSDRRTDHVSFGVVDPNLGLDQGLEGRGTRVVLRDGEGRVVVDLILGRPIEEGSERRFVRLPDSPRTYVATIKDLPDTRFAAWIEPDLLQLSSWEIDQLEYDNYRVVEDPRGAALEPGEKIRITKEGSEWRLSDLNAGEELQTAPIFDATRELDDLRIVGVRPKPAGLTARLTKAEGAEFESLATSLISRGYYLSEAGSIVSNEGDLHVRSTKGVRYTLRFGEVLYGDEASVSANDGQGEKQPEAGAANRFLMVTVAADETAFKAPSEPRPDAAMLEKRQAARRGIERIVAAIETWKGRHEGQLPASLSVLTEGDTPLLSLEPDPWARDYGYEVLADGAFRVVSLGEDGAPGGDGAAADIASDAFAKEEAMAQLAADWQRHDADKKAAEELALRLEERFAGWYYVISAAGYDRIKIARGEVAKAKEEAVVPEAADESVTPPGGGD